MKIDMSHLVGDERYHDRLTYDGLWENNLYQFFRIVSPKIQFDLPKPFKLEKDVTYKKKAGGLSFLIRTRL